MTEFKFSRENFTYIYTLRLDQNRTFILYKKKLNFSLLKDLTLCHILQPLNYWIAFFFSLCQATITNEYHMVPTLTVRATTLHLQLTYNYLKVSWNKAFKGGTPCIMIALAKGKTNCKSNKNKRHAPNCKGQTGPQLWSHCPKAWTMTYFFW